MLTLKRIPFLLAASFITLVQLSCATLPPKVDHQPTESNSMTFHGSAEEAETATLNTFKKLKIKYIDGNVEQGLISGKQGLTFTEDPYLVGIYFKKINSNQYDIWIATKWEFSLALGKPKYIPTILLNLRHSAAELGNPWNQNNLGVVYHNGVGVTPDYQRAVYWYNKAALQGFSYGEFNLGALHTTGQGVPQSSSLAIEWYFKAANSFLEESNKEMAIVCFDRITALNPGHPYLKELKISLYGAKEGDGETGDKSVNRPKEKSPATANEGEDRIYSTGTAWLAPNGCFVTNYHVVKDSDSINLFFHDGKSVETQIVLSDSVNDIAILSFDNNGSSLFALPISNAPTNPGAEVFTLGYPHPGLMGIEPKLANGIINARSGFKNDPRVYQISTPLQSGNSGGPLINMRGEVIGIATYKLDAFTVFKWTGDLPQNVNYAIKTSYLNPLLEMVKCNATRIQTVSVNENLESLAKKVAPSIALVIARTR